jgi:hypothetical protein
VLDLVKEWRARVRMLFTDHTAQGREGVKRFLELLKAGCVFCYVATGEEDELGGMDKEYRELVEEVKEQEAKYQGKQNTELEFKFSKLQDEFRDALTTRADCEIKKASSNGGEGGGVSLSRRQTPCLWSYAEARKSAKFLRISPAKLLKILANFCCVSFLESTVLTSGIGAGYKTPCRD